MLNLTLYLIHMEKGKLQAENSVTCTLHKIIKVNESRIRLVCHVACTEKVRNAYMIFNHKI